MPNHIHLILFISSANGRMISSPTEKRASIITAVGQMKRQVSKNIGVSIWQRSFYDHVIRDKKDYEKIAKYIYKISKNGNTTVLYGRMKTQIQPQI